MGTHPATTAQQAATLKWTVGVVVVLNLAYFVVEFGMARAIGSVALYADSIDFLEDASVNGLVLFTMGLSAPLRRLTGLFLAAVLLVPGLAALATAWHKLYDPAIADPLQLTLTALGALIVNSICALLLARVRNAGGSLSKAAFLSARNDALANVAMIGAGTVTAFVPSIWPDIIVGLAIAGLNATAALEVYQAANGENDTKQ